MRKGLLKNVQDGISKPIGSREIKKKKSGTCFAGHPVPDRPVQIYRDNKAV